MVRCCEALVGGEPEELTGMAWQVPFDELWRIIRAAALWVDGGEAVARRHANWLDDEDSWEQVRVLAEVVLELRDARSGLSQ